MSRGSYHGGGTVIGWGSYWERRYAFGTPEDRSVPSKKGSKRSARRARAKAAAAGEPTPAWAQKKFPKSNLSQQDVLAGLGLLPLPPKPHMRGSILKKLVAEGVLLPNGQPNPHDNKVRAIAARPGKKKK